MRRLIILLTLICMVLDSHAIPILENSPRIKYKDGPAFIYRVYLTDKDKAPYTLERPHRFLSHRSIERRKRQGLPLDSTDLPVHPGYIRQFRNRNMDVIGKSRWHNTLLIRLKDSTAVHQLDQMACVKDYKLVWLSPDSTAPNPTRSRYHDSFEEHAGVRIVNEDIQQGIFCNVRFGGHLTTRLDLFLSKRESELHFRTLRKIVNRSFQVRAEGILVARYCS